jgi:GMP synthase-like glutamine amidotransferase/tetratricopeptide (TPR) repeat protein
MRALALEHLHSNPIGVYGDVLTDRGIEVDRVLLDRGEALPDWQAYDLLIVMGGGMSAYDEATYPWLSDEKRTIREAVCAGMPYFGVCLGSQLLAGALGAPVYLGPEPELGVNPVFLCEAARADPVFRGLPPDLEVFEWHSDTFVLPEGATRLARSPRYENQAFRYGEVAYAIQCHLETTLDDVQDWFAAWPSLGEKFEERYGGGSLGAFLDEYASSMPRLRANARQLFRRWLENAIAHGTRSASRPNGSVPGSDGLLARELDIARLRATLAAARHGQGGAIAVVGPPGIGKTAVLAAIEREAGDALVLRAVGLDQVVEGSLAGLAAVCRPLLGFLPQLPERQAAVLALALREREGERIFDDRFEVYSAAAALLALASGTHVLLVLVDDAHLLDEPSREAFEFIGGRVAAERIAMVLTSEAVPGERFDVLVLQPLERPDALTLLDRHFGVGLDGNVARAVAEAAGGNPLALLEIAGVLTASQRAAVEPFDEILGACRSAEQAFLVRVSALPSDLRQWLVVIALGNGEPVEVVRAALVSMGCNEGDLAPAVAAGLLESAAGALTFRHDLARSTVAYGALRAERRAAHRALAKAAEGVDARAWHAALSLAEPDEQVAAALAETGVQTAGIGVFATAARALELSARITPDGEARAERLVAAADAAHRAGNTAAAVDHLEEALEALVSVEARGEAQLLLGRVLARSGSAARASTILLQAADEADASESALACRLLTAAVMPTLRAGDPIAAVGIGERALRLAPRDGDEEISARVGLATALCLGGDPVRARDLVRKAQELSVSSPGHLTPETVVYLARVLRLVGDDEVSRSLFETTVARARSTGAVSVLAFALVRLADVKLDAGEWLAATKHLHDAVAFAQETGQAVDRGLALAGLAWIAAAQGREHECRRDAARSLELAERLGVGSRLDRALPALGLLELGRGEFGAAVAILSDVCREQRAKGWCDAAIRPHCTPDLVEALLGTGDAAAKVELDAFEADAERTQQRSALAAVGRCRGLLSNGPEAYAFLSRAAAADVDVVGPFELGRNRLALGAWLRRHGRADEAAPELAAAQAAFEALGAEPWLRRAESAVA